MNTLILCFTTALILCTIGCDRNSGDSPCPKPESRGTFYLSPGSDEVIPYDSSEMRIVLTDLVGTEYYAEITDYSRDVLPVININDTCGYSDIRLYELDSERTSVILGEFGLDFLFILHPQLQFDTNNEVLTSYDGFAAQCSFYLEDTTNSLFIGIVVNTGNHPDRELSQPDHDTLKIHNKEFYDVYESEPMGGSTVMYYNAEVGLVGVVSPERSISLKYDRVE